MPALHVNLVVYINLQLLQAPFRSTLHGPVQTRPFGLAAVSLGETHTCGVGRGASVLASPRPRLDRSRPRDSSIRRIRQSAVDAVGLVARCHALPVNEHSLLERVPEFQ